MKCEACGAQSPHFIGCERLPGCADGQDIGGVEDIDGLEEEGEDNEMEEETNE